MYAVAVVETLRLPDYGLNSLRYVLKRSWCNIVNFPHLREDIAMMFSETALAKAHEHMRMWRYVGKCLCNCAAVCHYP